MIYAVSRFFIWENSREITIAVVIKAKASATGPANIMPSIPKNIGNMIMSGMRKITCRVMDKNTPLTGFPMAAKKLEDNN